MLLQSHCSTRHRVASAGGRQSPAVWLLVALFLLGCSPGLPTQPPATALTLRALPSSFEQPLFVTTAPGVADTLFIVEKTGRIQVVQGEQKLAEPLLDIRGQVSGGYEQGLLGLAFHPQFAENGLFFINYTDRAGHTQLVRYNVIPDTLKADTSSRALVMSIDQPAANHNGGMIAFGPDGYLYIGTGDGGGGGDPYRSGQNKQTLLGKLLRVDVDATDQGHYGIPPTNPFVHQADVRPEIWALGLRNPWRFSFDRLTGDLYIADVGQNRWEEINFQPADSKGGENYGWNITEGTHCYPERAMCDPQQFTLPVLEYAHSTANGCSVTGGFVYRGNQLPTLQGRYIYADFCSGRMWQATPEDDATPWTTDILLDSGLQISSFGEDADGELYVTDLYAGRVYRLEPK